MAWALYEAYAGIVFLALFQVETLLNLLDPQKLLDEKGTLDAVKAALPHYSKLLDEFGIQALPDLLPELELRLLEELKRSVRGEEEDKASAEQAARVMQLVGLMAASRVGVGARDEI